MPVIAVCDNAWRERLKLVRLETTCVFMLSVKLTRWSSMTVSCQNLPLFKFGWYVEVYTSVGVGECGWVCEFAWV